MTGYWVGTMKWLKRQDPFESMLRTTLAFPDKDQEQQYLTTVRKSLAWIKEEPHAIVVADGLLSDCPIVAVSQKFLDESKYQEEQVLHRDPDFLIDQLVQPDTFKISRSARVAMKSYCSLARFPGAINVGSGCKQSQPNALGDGSCVTNNFEVLRCFVAGHPLLVGIHHFQGISGSHDDEDDDDDALRLLQMRLANDQNLQAVLKKGLPEIQSEEHAAGLCHGQKAPGHLLFYNHGFGVLRQEPQILPTSGVIYIAKPLQPRHGSTYFSLRVETLVDWDGDLPMGFTRVAPEDCGFPKRTFPRVVQSLPLYVGFSTIGPVANDSNDIVEPSSAGWSKLQKWPEVETPTFQCGDIITVELSAGGQLRRYINKQLINSVDTGRLPEGDWYGVFEVSFRVARVCLVNENLNTPEATRPSKLVNKNQSGTYFTELLQVPLICL